VIVRGAAFARYLLRRGATMAKPSWAKLASQGAKSDPAVSYDEFMEFEGQRYTGMKIGRSHRWHYDRGDWKEKKITPDLWQVSYAVTKRRAGRAPEGSGVPVGTEYHWYIVAHQNTAKQTANDYTPPRWRVSNSRSRTSEPTAGNGARLRGRSGSA